MAMKSWVLQRVLGIGAITGRGDLAEREPLLAAEPRRHGEGELASGPSLANADDLGAYAPLIHAVRDELEHFVASHARLHVVIAERDSFTLTAIGVRSTGGPAARELLQRFMQEFRPEQVKRYLAREVIARLPNAAVIDLSQFAGLCDLEAAERGEEPYRELLAALEIAPQAAPARRYEISVLGRWSENDAAPRRGERAAATPTTPLAGRRCELDIEDGDGRRRAVLHAVVPGRRYVVGTGRDCDVRVSGAYTSRRHAELWFERGTWFVADAGSTNGIRVDSAQRGDGQDGARVAQPGSAEPIALDASLRVVLSACAEGPPADYPWIALRPAPAAAPAAATTPVAPRIAPTTPRTAVVTARAAEPVFEIVEAHGDAARVHAVRRSELPITIGRSRRQTLVIDWSHAGVSGHHVDIEAIDEHAAHGVVHGDNGVEVDGAHCAAGARFRWALGETMVLGGSLPGEPRCTLRLARREAV